MKSFSWKRVSEVRNQLMGIAILGTLAVHSNKNSGWMWNQHFAIVEKIFSEGSIGVDIFLFVSGIGLYFSMKRSNSTIAFYKKRFMRIIPTYLFITIIALLILQPRLGYPISKWLLTLSTLDFWYYGNSVTWYISFLLPFYFIYPFIYHFFEKTRKPLLAFCMLFFLTVTTEILIALFQPILFKRFPSVFSRLAISICGIYFGKNVYEDDKYTWKEITGVFLLFVILRIVRLVLFKNDNDNMVMVLVKLANVFFVIFLCMIYPIIEEAIPRAINNMLAWLGGITLEVYLIQSYISCGYSAYGLMGKNNNVIIYFTAIVPISIIAAALMRNHYSDTTVCRKGQRI